MCGICLIYKLKLSSEDLKIINDINEYNNSFNDIGDKDKEDEISKTVKENFLDLNEFLNSNIYDLKGTISSRGPDYFNLVDSDLTCLDEKINNYKELFDYVLDADKSVMISSVLNLRGIESITKQPIICTGGNILQYNGEIYILKDKNEEFDLYVNNDGVILSELLNKYSIAFNQLDKDDQDNTAYSEGLFAILNNIESDHAFVFTDKINNKIVLSRDIFGKRSLIFIYFVEFNIITICSALPGSIYNNRTNKNIIIIEIPANSLLIIETLAERKIHFFKNNYIKYPSQLRFNNSNNYFTSNGDLENICSKLLMEAVYKRVCNLPDIVKKDNHCSVAVLFSGGIDSLLLAYYTAANVSDDVCIDLINLSFAGNNAPDRNSGLLSYYELKKLFPNKNINLILVDKDYENDVEPIKEKIQALIFPKETHMDFNISTALHLATRCEGFKLNHQQFLEYFEKYYENIFETKDIKLTDNYNNDILSKKINKIEYENFIEKDKLYKSKSKIILHGLGADEFFGGYSRYKSSYQNGGAERLKEEMSKDINRIWTRNFGRDDRVCSDNGIELRYPFFDFELLSFLASVEDIKNVTNFEMPRGMGEKILLRKVCKNAGFKVAHCFEKRAIQFGTKLAKETNLKKYGSNRKANGKAQFK
jgi:asparagine synthetase B (glutamine-hydrolysing)